jgi:alpha-galactosidase
LPIRIPLGGATEFAIEVGDAGDGITADQADWADARVTLADGKKLLLGEMVLLQNEPVPSLQPLFSFTYGGKPSAGLLRDWEVKRRSKRLDDARTTRTATYSDSATGLAVRCEVVEYSDYPAVEWVLHFKNAGKRPTSLIEDIQALDVALTHGEPGEFVLHHAKGSVALADDFQPLDEPLKPKTRTVIGGGPSDAALPFFNVEWPGGGMIVGIGWPDTWSASFSRDAGKGLGVRVASPGAHFILRPGEEIRTPRILAPFWRRECLPLSTNPILDDPQIAGVAHVEIVGAVDLYCGDARRMGKTLARGVVPRGGAAIFQKQLALR